MPHADGFTNKHLSVEDFFKVGSVEKNLEILTENETFMDLSVTHGVTHGNSSVDVKTGWLAALYRIK